MKELLENKMPAAIEIETERLLLRQWKESDLAPFAVMNSDKRVMEFYPALLNQQESDAMANTCKSLIAEQGWGFWALEEKNTGRFIGFTGLHIPKHELPFSPCVEIGWRLAPEYWGKGLVTEAAQAALNIAFRKLGLDEVVSFTAKANIRSAAVMERLGMIRQASNFEHPALPKGHELSEHIWYKIERGQYI